MKLSEKECVPCRKGTPPLKEAEAKEFLKEISEWKMVNGHHLVRTYRFSDFKTALSFANRVGEMAEQVDHHPDLHIAWGKVTIEIWTHKIDGISESDFVFAAKCDRLF